MWWILVHVSNLNTFLERMSFVIPKKKSADGSEVDPMETPEPKGEAKAEQQQDGSGFVSKPEKKQATRRKSMSVKDSNAPKRPARYSICTCKAKVTVALVPIPVQCRNQQVFILRL
jgi:hypothetical protein